MITWLANLRGRSLAYRGAVLAVATMLALLAIGPVADHYGGLVGLTAATIAALLCATGAGLALVVVDRFRRPQEMLTALLAGTLIRMGVPLAAALAAQLSGALSPQAGLLYYLFAFYPVTLAVGTILSLPARPQAAPPGEAFPNAPS
jgi:hypothetical protein